MATRTSIHDVIDKFRAEPSSTERGTRFEKLMKSYFETDPTLASEYDQVKTWQEWKHNERTHDSGIDLVARNKHTGRWTAIQCKFYDSGHYLQKKDIDSFFTASGKSWDQIWFDNRIIISTTDHWSRNAEKALEHQSLPVQRIGLAEIAESPIDWMFTPEKLSYEPRKAVRYGLRPHQKEALEKIQEGFQNHDRGKWISACGTGKTFTSLKLAERRCADNDGHLKVLFLAPSIALVSQTLREWMAQSQTRIRPMVVCSDTKASRKTEDITTYDIPLPTTDAARLAEQMKVSGRRGKQMTVVFSTYQSIDVVARAQRESKEQFDLILCDEAHRTTGVTLPGGADESAFVKVHDNEYLPAAKRLYMTATPRIYGEESKRKAADHSAVVASMDDETVYGPQFHRLGFGEAVERNLLTDYKVMILCVDNDSVSDGLQSVLADEDHELSLDDAAKIVGCWNGLAKRTADMDFGPDPVPMRRAVAFAQNIKASEAFAQTFPAVVENLHTDPDMPDLKVAVHHVDGTMNALTREDELSWLKSPGVEESECRILSNARCLSEGVDVPALDAVLFLSPRNSLVDVVQSVGRVMRKAPGKEFGYIILPVAIDASESPDEAMRNNKRFKVVWDVLNALRSHDDRFKAMVNSIDLDKSTKGRIGIEVFGRDGASEERSEKAQQALGQQFPLFSTQLKDAILARIVKKVGEREYWENWADDVVHIHTNQVTRITSLLTRARAEDDELADAFRAFHEGLRANINESISEADAIDMLSQHLITQPVFEALFPTGSFARNNPVSATMQTMIGLLEGAGLQAETAALESFYASVRRSAQGVTTTTGRQTVIHRLYEQFFRKAFPKQSSSLGVVYTPVEIVDFILRSADDVCRAQFGYGLTDTDVHVQDPFTGTGTFIVRLLESGIIRPEDLGRKYDRELWANEIMLLAYYIACVNIETTYQTLTQARVDEIADQQRASGLAADADPTPGAETLKAGTTDAELSEPKQSGVGQQSEGRASQEAPSARYTPFPGATLTDTFQITEKGDRADTSLIPANNERIERQLAAPIQVIVGNPPYSAGQSSANDDNANLPYPTLDARITQTYAARSTATNKNSLYDSYIRAFRWASDRIGEQGVVAFVSNNGWVDGNTADGIRKTLVDEFTQIWVYNLRGNARTSGDTRKREGGGVFGLGARTGVAVLIAAKQPGAAGCQLHYHGVPDYQSREEKLADIDEATLASVPWRSIIPNEAGDWINQRNAIFDTFPPLGAKGKKETMCPIFQLFSAGLKTNRDAWCYNFSRASVSGNMSRMVENYNAQAVGDDIDNDPTKISWSRGLLADARRGCIHEFKKDRIYLGAYRPFTKQYAYFDRPLNDMVYQLEKIFPTPQHENAGFCVIESGARSPFSVLMQNALPDSKTYVDAAQFFPRWTYEKVSADDGLFAASSGEVDEYGYRRLDNITDKILAVYREKFGPQVSKDDIFHYVYGVLHSQQYREVFAADLKRMLPRIPLAASSADFQAFVDAGRALADLHVNYETVDPYPLHESTHSLDVDEWELYRVTKMRWEDKTTRKAIIYNGYLTLSDIPAAVHEYRLGSRSGLEWLIDRYQVKTDKASGIVNDPNDWCREHDDPRYIVDLVKRVTRVSVETMDIVQSLPELPISSDLGSGRSTV
ncbi:MAG: type ISP restriction/modification enzyme [Cutibacterium granulosum]|uniref:DEAD/DEAH box helicase n=2 Tax=Cutibacterium granulosum TaxID=33011 RepID=UPI002B22D04C|nr:type ISP restriction/modification enzyme [Cutibacterium granulosum]MEA5649144.1 type ISP restriction/modification enzyme [Cutibacterium granulosum]MEA5653469.1 type ISP restriction/modification enzyme [Cutibacterium granulosum]MEA5663800.1 type ISP restriction/modification enzyme [Cutibacterium granulosum]